MAQVFGVGDVVRVAHVDPEQPLCTDYLTAEGEVVDVDPEAYGRLSIVVRITEVNNSQCYVFQQICFCPDELDIVEES